MSLLDTARSDLQGIVDSLTDFGVPMTVTDPSGTVASLRGLGQDIHTAIDPETGAIITGSTVTVAIPIPSLTAVGLGIPKAVASLASKPWLVAFGGGTFRVKEARPDNTLGLVVCILEVYSTS